MKKKVGIVFLALLCATLVCGSFYLLKSRINVNPEGSDDLTAIQKLTTRDLDKDYPATPREVVKLYNKIILSYYEEEYTDQEFEALLGQAQNLMDDALRENNPLDTYKAAVQQEIENYKSRDRQIRQSTVCDSDDVLYTSDPDTGDDLAYVTSTYFVKEKNEFSRTYQMYVLRKDDAGHWKILTYYQIEKDPNMDTETD